MSTTQDSGDQSTLKSDVMALSALELGVLQKIAEHLATCGGTRRMAEFPLQRIRESVWPDEWRVEPCRARDECLVKLRLMGFAA